MLARKRLNTKYVEIVADQGSADRILETAQKMEAVDVRFGVVGKDGMRFLVTDSKIHSVLDSLLCQAALTGGVLLIAPMHCT